MLAMPADESIFAKLFSAAADSNGVPSSRSWSPDTPSRTPASFFEPEPSALRSSLQPVSNCFMVRGGPKSYPRASLNKGLRLPPKGGAAAGRVLEFVAIDMGLEPRLYRKVCRLG